MSGVLLSGYVTVAEFKAMPTRLAVDQLIVNAVQAAQDHELADILARASAWADAYCSPGLGAQPSTLLRQVRADRAGDVTLNAGTAPAIPVTVTSVGYGSSRTTTTNLANLTGVTVDGAQITAGIGGYQGTWQGSLQFGGPPPGANVWVTVGLITGWPSTQLAQNAAQGALSLTVVDATGISVGQVLTLPDPGSEETVTVTAVSGKTVTIATPGSPRRTLPGRASLPCRPTSAKRSPTPPAPGS